MQAIIETSREQTTGEQRARLLEEYRKALREWSRTRMGHQANDQAPEVLANMNRIRELELLLRNWACEQYGFTRKH